MFADLLSLIIVDRLLIVYVLPHFAEADAGRNGRKLPAPGPLCKPRTAKQNRTRRGERR